MPRSLLSERPECDHAGLAPEVVQLRDQLFGKDKLIRTLTDRLERAADELARQRPVRSGVAGIVADTHDDPAALLKAIHDDVQRLAGGGEDTFHGRMLLRIDSELAGLGKLVSNCLKVQSATVDDEQWHEAHWGRGTARSVALRESALNQNQTTAGGEADQAAPANQAESGTPARFRLDSFQIPDLPAPVDFETLSIEIAHEAISQRDAIINALREPLLRQQATEMAAAAAEQSDGDGLSTQMQQRILEVEARWEQKFRQHELELSVERARLAREEANLKRQQDQVNKERDQLRQVNAVGVATKNAAPTRVQKRLFRFLGGANAE